MGIGINIMRNLLLILFVLLVSRFAFAGSCTSITRSNLVDGNILSASDLNTQFGTAYSSINNADGGCIVDGSLELSALNTGDFNAQLKGVKRGCAVKKVATSSFTIGECIASVNNLNVGTVATTSVTYANLDTGTMATASSYYVYIKSGSTGVVLTPKISLTPPNGDGYNALGDMVLARFQTNTTSVTTREGSIYQWIDNSYKHEQRVVEYFEVDGSTGNITNARGGAVIETSRVTTGSYTYTGNTNYYDSIECDANPRGGLIIVPAPNFAWTDVGVVAIYDNDGNLTDSNFLLTCTVELKKD